MANSKMRDRIKNRANKNRNKETGVYILPRETKQFKPEAKTYKLDVISYRVKSPNNQEFKKGELADSREILVHNNIGEPKKQYICPRTIGKKCPICEYRQELIDDGYEKNKTIIKSLRPQKRVAYNVIDLDNVKDGVQFFCTSFFNFTNLALEEFCDDEDAMDYAELVGGKTVVTRFKTETFNGNSFVRASKIVFEDREDYDEDILEKSIDLDQCFSVVSYKELKNIFLEIEEEDIDDEEEEVVEKVKVKKVKVVEEIYEEEEEIEEEPPPPPPKKKVTRKAPTRKTVPKKVVDENEKTLDTRCPFAQKIRDEGEEVEFGRDANKFSYCENCDEDMWNSCCDDQEARV